MEEVSVCDNCRMTELEILLADGSKFALPWLETRPLSESSHIRLAQISSEGRRRQFLLGRWLMALAAGVEPASIEEGPDYPQIPARPDCQASISHSGPYVAVITSRGFRCGLDIEYPTRQRDWIALAWRTFAASEAAWIAEATAADPAERFQRIWTLREAAFKAGLLSSVAGREPVFEPASARAVAGIGWQYLQEGGLHVSAVAPQDFRMRIHRVDPPETG